LNHVMHQLSQNNGHASSDAHYSQFGDKYKRIIDVFDRVKSTAETLLSAAVLTDPMQQPPIVTDVVGPSRVTIPLKMQLSRTYTTPGMALIGDAAHTIHPLAGQGLNLGFSDVESLFNELRKAVETGQDIGSPIVLQEYAKTRQAANTGMALTMDAFKHLFAHEASSFIPFLRNFGLGTLNGIPMIKNEIMRRAMGI